jgi:hypothetical protein
MTFEELSERVQQLSLHDRVRLMEMLVSTLKHELPPQQPIKSLYGLWEDLEVDISEDDIDEIRREMWGNFPREDI